MNTRKIKTPNTWDNTKEYYTGDQLGKPQIKVRKTKVASP